jgi:ATP/maltotriose-dependent transcriptional regulator MalT
MPLVSVTFDVVLTEEEVTAMGLVMLGFSNERIAVELKTTQAHVDRCFSNLRLAGPLNLVDATRRKQISLRLRTEP